VFKQASSPDTGGQIQSPNTDAPSDEIPGFMEVRRVAAKYIPMAEPSVMEYRNRDQRSPRVTGGQIRSHSHLTNVECLVRVHTLVSDVLVIGKHSLRRKGVGKDTQVKAFESDPAIQQRTCSFILAA
jgi:hypothetical protein